MFGKQLRKEKFADLLKPKLDNPSFPTAVARLFAFDIQARGVYKLDSKSYEQMVTVITDYVSYFRETTNSELGWTTSEAVQMKTMLAIAFGAGNFCGTSCGQAHIDIFKHDECNLTGGSMKFKPTDKHTPN